MIYYEVLTFRVYIFPFILCFHSEYDVKKHPKFNSGKWTEKQVLEEFLKSFEAPDSIDGKVFVHVCALHTI